MSLMAFMLLSISVPSPQAFPSHSAELEYNKMYSPLLSLTVTTLGKIYNFSELNFPHYQLRAKSLQLLSDSLQPHGL